MGYVLRVFPSLSQTFVLNEILALERPGLRVTVLVLDPANSDRDLVLPESGPRELIDLDEKGQDLAAALCWLSLHHPLRLARVSAKLAAAHNAHLRRAFVKAIQVVRCAERERLEHLHAHLRLGTDVAWLAHRLTGRSFSFTAHSGNL